jgi:hypothetical protein
MKRLISLIFNGYARRLASVVAEHAIFAPAGLIARTGAVIFVEVI